MQQMLLLRH
jgi:hypothetical protein